MSRMPPQSQKKRKLDDAARGKTSRPKKKIRKQLDYHSSSDEESDASGSEIGFAPVNLQDSDEEAPQKQQLIVEEPQKPKPKPTKRPIKPSSDAESNSVSSDDDADSQNQDGTHSKPRTKRNDPLAFSTSISKILSTKLSQSARSDPLLSRSKAAHQTTTSLSQSKLESRAKYALRQQRRVDLERNRVTDVLGLESGNAGEVAAEEKRLRKIAQRGVVKLFNAVRAAQVRSEEVLREEREMGVVGRKEREERAKEMSREGFLELIGGKGQKGRGVGEG